MFLFRKIQFLSNTASSFHLLQNQVVNATLVNHVGVEHNNMLRKLKTFYICFIVFSCLIESMFTLTLIYNSSDIETIFSSPEHKELMVSYCDRPLSVVRRRAACVVRRT